LANWHLLLVSKRRLGSDLSKNIQVPQRQDIDFWPANYTGCCTANFMLNRHPFRPSYISFTHTHRVGLHPKSGTQEVSLAQFALPLPVQSSPPNLFSLLEYSGFQTPAQACRTVLFHLSLFAHPQKGPSREGRGCSRNETTFPASKCLQYHNEIYDVPPNYLVGGARPASKVAWKCPAACLSRTGPPTQTRTYTPRKSATEGKVGGN
jgi:hypothetical protein